MSRGSLSDTLILLCCRAFAGLEPQWGSGQGSGAVMTLQFYLSCGFQPPAETIEMTRLAEELGFYGVSLGDHLFYSVEPSTPYPYTESGQPLFPLDAPGPTSGSSLGPWGLSACPACISGPASTSWPSAIPRSRPEPWGPCSVLAEGRFSFGGRSGTPTRTSSTPWEWISTPEAGARMSPSRPGVPRSDRAPCRTTARSGTSALSTASRPARTGAHIHRRRIESGAAASSPVGGRVRQHPLYLRRA